MKLDTSPRSTSDDLRREFDRLFATPPRDAGQGLECFVTVRIGGDRFALRLAELAGLEARRRVTPLPCGNHSLLGLAGVRGRLVPVYDLASLLGYGARGQDAWRWMGLCRAGGHIVGLAFELLGEFIRIAPSDVHPIAGSTPARDHIHDVLSVRDGDGQVQGVVSVSSILAAIAQRARPVESREELGTHGT